ncbi:malonyl-CoA O-methyltransferase [Tamilnaduibacter salinus]|uniref:Malonyl-[acyl-carrier protein] O-methyltransferase n=1 Tax=Tamilnaduibacter salinus TaxID=1484056 RepID=A0A2A2I5E2_9GAMM|nr:malonyl-ACP O-methyltransferase BioC [Tamilnaduibacter salinus]PAV26340.1 malonyl-[acyl-carrier protein] O-methyltransferase BioC [Tamilnaduibacter salinus]PVY70719.1 malonyl-CoA O-methyltransferase [Tamilnaduibacter salinus]
MTHAIAIAEKPDVARDFGAAASGYDGAARLQRHMGDQLLSQCRLSHASAVTDLGCGTGWFTARLAEALPGARFTGVDLSPGMLAQARSSRRMDADWVVADAEQLPLADNSQDLVFSNLMIQWCDAPGRVLAECRRVLRPGGQLLVSTLLDGTLRELRQAWQVADPDVPHVNRFETPEGWSQIVSQAFHGARLTRETVTLGYESPRALLRELKELGAHNKSPSRRKTATAPARLRACFDAYPRLGDGRVEATYKAAYLSVIPD